MRRNTDNVYTWQFYQKTLLGFASVLGWLPIVWWLAGTGLGLLFHAAQNTPHFPEIFFWGYIIICIVIHIIIFGGMAYAFPKFYILPAWGLNLYFLYLGFQKIILYLIYLDEPDKFYYFESGKDRFHSFTSKDIYLTVIELFFLIILFHPALFHFRKIINRDSWPQKGKE